MNNTFNEHLNQSDSPILDINESFVKSDIAEIISKMYTPVERVSDITQGGVRVTPEQKNCDQETTNWRRSACPSNHFGLYIETVQSESEVRTVIDSSTSDEVSVPIVENIPRPHGYICRCCRRKVERGISKQTKTECTNCKQKLIVKNQIEKLYQPNTLDYFSNRQRHKDGYCRKFEGRLENRSLGYRKSAPAIVYNRQIRPKQEKRHNSNRQTCISENCSNNGCFQVVPDLSVDDAIRAEKACKCSSNTKVAKKTTIFKRVVNSVSTWPVIFYQKTKQSTLLKVNNIDNQNVNQNHDYLLSCQKQTSQIIQCSPRRVPEGNLLKHHRDENNTIKENRQIKQTVPVPIEEEPETSTYFHYGGTQIEWSSLDERNNSNSRGDIVKSISKDNVTRIIQATSRENVNKEGIIGEDVKEMTVTNSHFGTNVDKADWANSFWSSFFGPSHLVTSFFTAFILHFLAFLLGGIVRPLLWDSVQVASEHLFQPFLKVLLNSILKPIFKFLQSIAESFSDICLPVAQSFGHVIRESSYICRACRLVEINTANSKGGVQNV